MFLSYSTKRRKIKNIISDICNDTNLAVALNHDLNDHSENVSSDFIGLSDNYSSDSINLIDNWRPARQNGLITFYKAFQGIVVEDLTECVYSQI